MEKNNEISWRNQQSERFGNKRICGSKNSRGGVLIYGQVVTNSVNSKTSTTVNKMTLSAGVYIISANVQFSISTTAVTVANIYRTGTGTIAIERGTMLSGGGHSLCAIERVTDDTEIVCNVYHTHTATTTISINSLRAVKIN